MRPNDDAPPAAATVFVVEDDAGTRASLTFHMRAMGQRVQAYEAAEPFLAAFDPQAQGCVLTDLRLPGMNGLALQEELVRRGSHLPVIVVTAYAEVPLAVRAMRAGAVDFLEKPFAPGAVAEAVAQALRRNGTSPSSLWQEAEAAAARFAALSEREREVVEGLAAGRLGKQVAAELGLSPRTVEIYRANAARKLRVRTQSDLIRLGILARLNEVTY